MTRGRLMRELKHLGQGWCILVSIGATIGGVWGWLTWPDDQES